MSSFYEIYVQIKTEQLIHMLRKPIICFLLFLCQQTQTSVQSEALPNQGLYLQSSSWTVRILAVRILNLNEHRIIKTVRYQQLHCKHCVPFTFIVLIFTGSSSVQTTASIVYICDSQVFT